MILIIAKGDTYKYLNQIYKVESEEEAFRLYGRTSVLAMAASRAFELGQEKLYVCNIQSDSDYFEIIEQVRALSLECILLPGLRFNQTLLLKDKRELPISLILSELLPRDLFILNDYHAREFKNQTHFLSHYNTIRESLDKMAKHKKNIVLVANHLRLSDEASVDVACCLSKSETGDYPRLLCGETVLDLEYEDFSMPVVYFKNEIALNLFNIDRGIDSNLVVQHMIKTLNKEILDDLNYLIGTRFTRNTLFTVKSRVEKLLNMRQNNYYKKYTIIDIIIVDDEIAIIIDVYPFFAIDAIRANITVKGI